MLRDQQLDALLESAPVADLAESEAVGKDGPRGLGVVRLADVEPQSISWLWPGRLPLGKLVVLDGDPSLGKSTLALDLAARVTTGSPMPDGAGLSGPAGVVLLTAEDGLADTVRPRFDAAHGDPRRLVVFESVPSEENPLVPRPPSIPGDLEALEVIVREEGAALVIVDVLNAFLHRGVDSHRDQDVRGALRPLAGLADRTGACVVVLRHLNKAGGTNALYRGGGSIGIIGAARTGLLVAVDPDDDSRRVLAVTKSNLAQLPPSLAYRLEPADEHGCAHIAWEGATEHRAGDLLRVESETDRTERDAAEDWLRQLLADGPMPRAQVVTLAKKEGHAERTLERARERLGVVREYDETERGRPSTWRLP